MLSTAGYTLQYLKIQILYTTGCDQVKFCVGHIYVSALELYAILNFYEKIAKIDKVHIIKVQTINALGNFM